MLNYFLLLLGLLIHISLKIASAKKKHKGNFNLTFWFIDNIWYIIPACLSAFAIVLTLTIPDEAYLSFGIFKIDVMRFGCLLAGYGNGSLFQNLSKFIPKKK